MGVNYMDKALECIWIAEKEGVKIGKETINIAIGKEFSNESLYKKLLKDIKHQGLINIDRQKITLTDLGRIQAEMTIRRHMLAERLVHDVLDSNIDEYESRTCNFDLYIADDIVTSICTLLGHPRTCPHGHTIPLGKCCTKKTKKELNPIIYPISELHYGNVCKVVRISTLVDKSLNKTAKLNITTGTKLRIHQVDPMLVIQIGQSYVTIDTNLAHQIYVRCEGK